MSKEAAGDDGQWWEATATATVDRLAACCPSVRVEWERFIANSYEPGERRLAYMDAGEIGRHVLRLMDEGRGDEIKMIFDCAEEILNEGDDVASNLVIVGFIEGLQNQASWPRPDGTTAPVEDLTVFLGSETRSAWDYLEALWRGEIT